MFYFFAKFVSLVVSRAVVAELVLSTSPSDGHHIDHPIIALSKIALPNISNPNIVLPNIFHPNIALASIVHPNIALPNSVLPNLTLSNSVLPANYLYLK